jgi:hypothetical protein
MLFTPAEAFPIATWTTGAIGVTAAVVVSVVHSLDLRAIDYRQRANALSSPILGPHASCVLILTKEKPFQPKSSLAQISARKMRAVPGSLEVKLDRQLHLSRRVD